MAEKSEWARLKEELLANDPGLAKRLEDTHYIQEFMLLRSQRGLTQTELARRAGTTQESIARLERHVHEPRISTLRRLVEAMGGRLVIRIESDPEPVAVELPAPAELGADLPA